MPAAKKKTETRKVKSKDLVQTVKNLVKEGNVRKITIKDKEGNTLLRIPVTIGIVGVVLAPFLAGVAAIAAVVTECTISVERK